MFIFIFSFLILFFFQNIIKILLDFSIEVLCLAVGFQRFQIYWNLLKKLKSSQKVPVVQKLIQRIKNHTSFFPPMHPEAFVFEAKAFNRYSFHGTVYSLLVSFCSLIITFFSLFVTFYWLLAAFYSLLVTFHSLLVSFYWLLVNFVFFGRFLLVTRYFLPVTCYVKYFN